MISIYLTICAIIAILIIAGGISVVRTLLTYVFTFSLVVLLGVFLFKLIRQSIGVVS